MGGLKIPFRGARKDKSNSKPCPSAGRSPDGKDNAEY